MLWRFSSLGVDPVNENCNEKTLTKLKNYNMLLNRLTIKWFDSSNAAAFGSIWRRIYTARFSVRSRAGGMNCGGEADEQSRFIPNGSDQ